jgi:hypothetical protein
MEELATEVRIPAPDPLDSTEDLGLRRSAIRLCRLRKAVLRWRSRVTLAATVLDLPELRLG